MAIQKLSMEQFLACRQEMPVLDVRSPGEYGHAHIPFAYSTPLFTDEERKVVGTLYKQQGKQKAIKAGLSYFGTKMTDLVEQAEAIIKKQGYSANKLIVHCWRGGMRSAGVAWLLDLYGFEVFILTGGYKNFRRRVLSEFEKDKPIHILGGYTGSAKTDILQAMGRKGEHIIDLEGIASHKGSAFGALGQDPQPTQEMFENLLALQLMTVPETGTWMEDESQRIGRLNIPHALWATMRNKPVYFVDIPKDLRLAYITENYGRHHVADLIAATERIQKRLGGLEAKNTIENLQKGNIIGAFGILLAYYDKLYLKGLHNREGLESRLSRFESEDMDINRIADSLIIHKKDKRSDKNG
jgi:tRNA 2-selenouridine synthase